MQLGGSEKRGRFASGIIKAARAARELELENPLSVNDDDKIVESGIRFVGGKTADGVMKVIEGNTETVH